MNELPEERRPPDFAERRGKVLQFPARPSRPPTFPWRAREWIAMAASLLVGVLLSWRIFSPADSALMVATQDGLIARGALANALENQLAGVGPTGPALIGLTFKARDGQFCRSFALRVPQTIGLACRVGSDWHVRATDSAPASGELPPPALSPAMLAALESRIDGVALDAEAERAALEAGWKAP